MADSSWDSASHFPESGVWTIHITNRDWYYALGTFTHFWGHAVSHETYWLSPNSSQPEIARVSQPLSAERCRGRRAAPGHQITYWDGLMHPKSFPNFSSRVSGVQSDQIRSHSQGDSATSQPEQNYLQMTKYVCENHSSYQGSFTCSQQVFPSNINHL